MLDVRLGDPGPGRSWLDQQRSKPPEPEKVFSISASRAADASG
jgi:hypothetical protein